MFQVRTPGIFSGARIVWMRGVYGDGAMEMRRLWDSKADARKPGRQMVWHDHDDACAPDSSQNKQETQRYFSCETAFGGVSIYG